MVLPWHVLLLTLIQQQWKSRKSFQPFQFTSYFPWWHLKLTIFATPKIWILVFAIHPLWFWSFGMDGCHCPRHQPFPQLKIFDRNLLGLFGRFSCNGCNGLGRRVLWNLCSYCSYGYMIYIYILHIYIICIYICVMIYIHIPMEHLMFHPFLQIQPKQKSRFEASSCQLKKRRSCFGRTQFHTSIASFTNSWLIPGAA